MDATVQMLDDWKATTLGEICGCGSGLQTGPFGSQLKAEEYVPVGVPVVMPRDIVDGCIVGAGCSCVSIDKSQELSKHRLLKGDVVFSRRGEVGVCALVSEMQEGYLCGTGCLRARPDPSIDPVFLISYLTTEGPVRWLRQNAIGQTMPNLNTYILASLPIRIPPPGVRNQLRDVSITFNQGITKTKLLIGANLKRKRAMLQPLITGKLRFSEYMKARWRTRMLGEFLSESRIKGSDGATARKLTIKLYSRGVVPKTEKIAGSAATLYFVRKSGQFIYSKLDFLNGAFGVVPDSLDGYETTADLPAFDVEGGLNARWLLAYVSREHFYRTKLGVAAGGRKARRVNPAAFLKIEIPVPSRAEQDKIVDFLDTLDRQLGLLTRQADALSRQKKCLMEKLLTGQIRVKG